MGKITKNWYDGRNVPAHYYVYILVGKRIIGFFYFFNRFTTAVSRTPTELQYPALLLYTIILISKKKTLRDFLTRRDLILWKKKKFGFIAFQLGSLQLNSRTYQSKKN